MSFKLTKKGNAYLKHDNWGDVYLKPVDTMPMKSSRLQLVELRQLFTNAREAKWREYVNQIGFNNSSDLGERVNLYAAEKAKFDKTTNEYCKIIDHYVHKQ